MAWGAVVVWGCSLEPTTLQGFRYESDEAEEAYAVEDIHEVFSPDSGWLLSPPVSTDFGASRVSAWMELKLDDSRIDMEARGINEDGTTTEWRRLETIFSEENARVLQVEIIQSKLVQLRMKADQVDDIHALSWSAVLPAQSEDNVATSDIGSASSPLRTELQALGVHPRSSWTTTGSGGCDRETHVRDRMSIHHTVSPTASRTSTPARLRSIRAYHRGKGFCDVGYHFAIDPTGEIYEARPLEWQGAHVHGENEGNIGISLIGCYGTTCRQSYAPREPSDAIIASAARLVAALSELYDIPRNTMVIRGHTDWPNVDKDCPGLYVSRRMDEILGGTYDPGDDGGGGNDDDDDGGDDGGSDVLGVGESCTYSGRAGSCIDTSQSSCEGSVHRGLCPGSSVVRCCVPPPEGGSDEPGVGTACSSGSRSGACIDTGVSSCGGLLASRLCPGSSAVKCCLTESTAHGAGESCGASGTCIDTGVQSCDGRVQSGLCPGTSAIRCCLP